MKKIRIGIITYDNPHLKTEQVIEALLRRGYDLRIFGLPFLPRPERTPLFDHRPDQRSGLHPRVIAERHNIDFKVCEDDAEIDDSCDAYHVLIGRLISAGTVAGCQIINCHPGILPAVRGLDAFKWAIYDQAPLGVTLHYIDNEVDKGEVISVVPTHVYPTDTIESLARRHYATEIDVVARFEHYLRYPINDYETVSEGPRHMRMSREKEREVLELFDRYVRLFS